MTDPTFLSRALAQKAGWFSRRHQSDEPHREAVRAYKLNRGKKARQRRAAERLEAKPPAFDDLAKALLGDNGVPSEGGPYRHGMEAEF